MDFTLQVWRQDSPDKEGRFEVYRATNISSDMSFIEMLESLNIELEQKGDTPVSYECDCLEGICGTCSLMINGRAHGPGACTTTCQLHMRTFQDGDTIVIEPFRAKSFPVIKDLIVNRSAFDRIIQQWTLRNALDVAPVLLLAKIARQCFLLLQKSLIFPTYRKVNLKEWNGLRKWWNKWTKKVSALVPIRQNAKPYVLKV
jgi:hypothetical protein